MSLVYQVYVACNINLTPKPVANIQQLNYNGEWI